jgi:hypothetical protein
MPDLSLKSGKYIKYDKPGYPEERDRKQYALRSPQDSDEIQADPGPGQSADGASSAPDDPAPDDPVDPADPPDEVMSGLNPSASVN